jgi:hypothetical protein
MTNPTRRSVLRRSLTLAATGSLARPFIANAAAKTATVWWVQGFAQEEDVAFKQLVADYEKASGSTIDHSIIPYAPMRQKIVSAVPRSRYLKAGLGRRVPAMPSLVKNDPWCMEDPHRKAYMTQALLRPTVPVFWAYNPAYAHVRNEHVWQTAWAETCSKERSRKPPPTRRSNWSRRSLRNTDRVVRELLPSPEVTFRP